MGMWNAKLYGNDTTSDVRAVYIDYLKKGISNDDAYKKTYEEFRELLGTDEEGLFWLALADTQSSLGRLTHDVKEKALTYINQGAKYLFEDMDKKNLAKWEACLNNLEIKLNAPQPSEKKIPIPREFVRNPWNIGDIYVYQLHTEKAKEFDLFGKYIAMQKVADCPSFDNLTFSVIQIYNKTFKSIPTISDIIDTDTLILRMPTDAYRPRFERYAVMEYAKISHYPKKYLTFIGSVDMPNNVLQHNFCRDFTWEQSMMEIMIVDFYMSWKNINIKP